MKEEEWRPITLAPNYAVSDLGRVKRLTPGPKTEPGRIKQPVMNSRGYLCVTLLADGKQSFRQLHRLVCIAFHGEPPTPKHECAHGDGDKANCRSDNLRWATSTENAADKKAHGSRVSTGPRLSKDQVNIIRFDERRHALIAADFDISVKHVGRIKSGRCHPFIAKHSTLSFVKEAV